MSLFAALNVAVNGLSAQSDAIGNISDDISNADTVGYKAVDTSFSSLVTQSDANSNSPGGVRATPSYQNSLQGNLSSSTNPTSLAISGSGFFSVAKPTTNSSGAEVFTNDALFTRRGDFTLDQNGYLVNGAGYVLNGYTVDSAGNVNSSATTQVKISNLIDNPVATSTVTYSANLPASAQNTTSFTPSSINLFDQIGAQHTLNLTWEKGQTGQTNTWYLKVSPTDATTTSGGITSVGDKYLKFVFNSNGNNAGTISSIQEVTGYPASSSAADIAAADAAPSSQTFSVTADAVPNHTASVTFANASGVSTLNYPNAGPNATTINFGQYGISSGVTQFDSTGLSVTSLEQNGIPRGSFKNLSIDQNGFVNVNYDNGSSRTLYQIPVVQFNSPNNLQRADGDAFTKTTASGTARYGAAGSVGGGTIVGSTLEGSNVDIANEFTKMIVAQRIYSANSKTITTTNSMLDELINIVR